MNLAFCFLLALLVRCGLPLLRHAAEPGAFQARDFSGDRERCNGVAQFFGAIQVAGRNAKRRPGIQKAHLSLGISEDISKAIWKMCDQDRSTSDHEQFLIR
jgi:hypothetical protein